VKRTKKKEIVSATMVDLFQDQYFGDDSCIMHDGLRWVYWTEGMYISELGHVKEL
jgi:hypothetical protein